MFVKTTRLHTENRWGGTGVVVEEVPESDTLDAAVGLAVVEWVAGVATGGGAVAVAGLLVEVDWVVVVVDAALGDEVVVVVVPDVVVVVVVPDVVVVVVVPELEAVQLVVVGTREVVVVRAVVVVVVGERVGVVVGGVGDVGMAVGELCTVLGVVAFVGHSLACRLNTPESGRSEIQCNQYLRTKLPLGFS